MPHATRVPRGSWATILRRQSHAALSVAGEALHGELSNASESPSSPGRSWAFAESGGINLKELALDYSTPGASVQLRSQ